MTLRNRPHVGFTIDADVLAWLKAEAKKQRRSLSGLVTHILAKAMEEDTPSLSARGPVKSGKPCPPPVHPPGTRAVIQLVTHKGLT